MKQIFKTFAALMAVSMLLWACDPQDPVDPDKDKTEQGDNDKPNSGDNSGSGNQPGTGDNQPGSGNQPGTGDNQPGTGDNQPGTGDDQPDQPSMMTPGQHQQKLEQVALDFMSYFDAFDNKRLIDAEISLEECLSESDNEPFEHLDVDDGGLFHIWEYLDDEDAYQLIYDLNLSSGEASSYDPTKQIWVKGKTNANSVKCSWIDGYEFVISWSNSSKVYDWDIDIDYEEYENEIYRFYIPSEVVAVLKQNGDELMRVTLKPNMTDKYVLAPDYTISLYSGYTFSSNISADRVGVSSNFVMKKGSKELISYNMAMAINDITDIEGWLIKVEEEWDGGVDEWYEFDTERFGNSVKTGSFQINILDDVAIAASGDFLNIYDNMEELDEKYSDEKTFTDECVKLINDRVQAKMFYCGTNTALCDIVAQTTRDSYQDYVDGSYQTVYEYYVEPIMVFEDGTKFAFDTFFSESKFREVIDSFEKLVEDFDDIYNGQ